MHATSLIYTNWQKPQLCEAFVALAQHNKPSRRWLLMSFEPQTID